MNLADFCLEKEDSENMHIKHPSGKVLIVSKATMSDKAKNMVKKMAKGGEVAQEMEVVPDKGFGKIIRVGLEGGGFVDSLEKSAGELGNKIKSAVGAGKVEQDYGKPAKDRQAAYVPKYQDNKPKKNPSTYAGSEDPTGYACGGSVQGYYEGTGGVEPQEPIEQEPYNPRFGNVDLVTRPNIIPEQQPAPVVEAPEQPGAQSVAPMQDPMIQQKMSSEDLLNKEQGEAQQVLGAQQSAGKASSQAYEDYQKEDQKLKNANDLYNEFEAKDNTLAKNFMDNKVDANRYWHSLGTGSKIAAGISLVLGGIGAGLTNGKNPAQEWLNKAIDNDIESQRNDQSKSMNLWKMNREAYGDAQRANLATQNQLYTVLQAKLAQASQQVQAPEAQFRTKQMIDQIEQQKIANRQRLGLLSAGVGEGGKSQADPLQLATDPNIVPQDRQKDVIEQLGKAQYVTRNEKQLMQLFDQAEEENTALGRVGRLGHEPPSMKALRLLGVPLVKDADGKVNELAMSTFEDVLPGPLERGKSGQEKRAAFQKFINQHKDAPMAKAYGIDPNRFESTATSSMQQAPKLNERDSTILNWAKAHPSEPKAQQALDKFRKMGVK